MKVNEVKNLFERIKRHYNTFGYDEMKLAEWHRFLKHYTTDSILNNLDNFIMESHDRPPLLNELTRNAIKTDVEETKAVYIPCEYCKEKILVGDDWTEYNKHHRRCSKIDFINRESRRIRGEDIDFNLYVNMSDNELDTRYNKIMRNWENDYPTLNVKNLFTRL